MRRRELLPGTVLAAACAGLALMPIVWSDDELPGDGRRDVVTDARFDESRTRLMIWTEDGYNHPSCTDTDIDIDRAGDVWHVSVGVHRTSKFCELDLPITEDWHDAWLEFDEPVDDAVTVTF